MKFVEPGKKKRITYVLAGEAVGTALAIVAIKYCSRKMIGMLVLGCSVITLALVIHGLFRIDAQPEKKEKYPWLIPLLAVCFAVLIINVVIFAWFMFW